MRTANVSSSVNLLRIELSLLQGIGILAGTTTGIEPLFAVAYKRRFLTDGTKWKYQYVVDGTADILIQRWSKS
jgi:hypothetical protein